MLAGVVDGLDHALDAAGAEAAGHHNAAGVGQEGVGAVALDVLGVHPPYLHVPGVAGPGVAEGLAHRQVGVGVFDVLAHQGDGHLLVGAVHPLDHSRPVGHVAGVALEPQGAEDDVAQSRFLKEQGHLIDVADRLQGDDGVAGDIAERRNLLADAAGHRVIAAADDGVGLDADGPKLLDAVLGGLGLQLLGRRNIRKEGQVDVEDIVAAHLVPHLADGLQEGEALDIADGAADLDDDDLRAGLGGEAEDVVLDVVGDVGDGLDGAAEEIAAAFLGDQVEVDLAGGEVGGAGELEVDEALVVAEVEVGLAAVLGDEDLAVLVGGHGAGVDVEVGVELEDGDGEAAAFEDAPDRGDADPLAQRADHAPGHEDKLCRHQPTQEPLDRFGRESGRIRAGIWPGPGKNHGSGPHDGP